MLVTNLTCPMYNQRKISGQSAKPFTWKWVSFSWNRGLGQQNTGNPIDLIHDTRHLCTRLRTDGIKVTSRACFLRGQASDKICQCKKSRSSLFILNNRKWITFYLKDDNGKLWVKVIIVTFLDAVATVDVLTASHNDVNVSKLEP